MTLGLNVPIDKTLVNKLKSESYSLLWFNKQRLWETNIYLNNTLYVVDFKNIYSKMNILKLEQIINNEDSFHLFYKGFLSKYFPYVTYLHLKKFLESGKLNEEKKLITQDLMNEQYYLELIKNIKKEDINIKLKHTSLISTNIHVNYYMPPPNFIEMRDLFDFFVLDENIPYVKFRNSIENSVDTKILEDIYVFDNKTFVDWTDNMPHGISFRIKKSLNPKSDSYKKYSIVNIFPDGKIEFKVTWKEEEHANFADIDEALCSLRNLIIKINDMDSRIFKNNQTISVPSEENTVIAYVTTITQFDNPHSIKFELLEKVAKLFTPWINIDKHYKLNDEKNVSGLFTKYIRQKTKASSRDGTIYELIRMLKEKENYNDKQIMMEIQINFAKTLEEAKKYIDEAQTIFLDMPSQNRLLKKRKFLEQTFTLHLVENLKFI